MNTTRTLERFCITLTDLHFKLSNIENAARIVEWFNGKLISTNEEYINFEYFDIDENSKEEEILEFVDVAFRNMCFDHLSILGRETTKNCCESCLLKSFRLSYNLPEVGEKYDTITYIMPKIMKNVEDLEKSIKKIQKEVDNIEYNYRYFKKIWQLRHERGCLDTNEQEKWQSLKFLELLDNIVDALYQRKWSFESVSKNIDFKPFIEIDEKIKNKGR